MGGGAVFQGLLLLVATQSPRSCGSRRTGALPGEECVAGWFAVHGEVLPASSSAENENGLSQPQKLNLPLQLAS